ncbi:MAG: ABC transporter ATP-binding protein, partial [Clostridiales bacterium 43-6]
MLTVQHVTKRYGGTIANHDVSFSCPTGEISVILGPNGAGKSTVIKSIMGLLRYDGEIFVDGLPNKSVEAKRLLGYVPEMPALYELLTVGEHLEFIARAYKLENYELYIDELLRRFELYDKKNKLSRELSKGMQQKVSICCALLHKPKMIVFDEPMVGLDPHAIKELKQVFTELKNSGCAVVISTHMIDSINDIWDRAVIMSRGVVKAVCEKAGVDGQGTTLEQVFFDVTEG